MIQLCRQCGRQTWSERSVFAAVSAVAAAVPADAADVGSEHSAVLPRRPMTDPSYGWSHRSTASQSFDSISGPN